MLLTKSQTEGGMLLNKSGHEGGMVVIINNENPEVRLVLEMRRSRVVSHAGRMTDTVVSRTLSLASG
jgi:hypothetical protein